MAKTAPNFIRLDTPVTAANQVILWISDDYVGDFPYVIYNALGYPVSRGVVKAKQNKLPLDANAGIFSLVIGTRSFLVTKTGE